MKLLTPLRLFLLVAGLSLALPAVSRADHDHDRDHDRDHGHFFGRGRFYRPYYYGDPYFFGAPYYYGAPFYGPGVGFSYYGGRGGSDERYADDLAVDVQRALKRRGYYGGAIDGDIGPGTRNALRRYQDDHRLDATGRIDRDTLRALNL